jgi:hypothetical protein
VRRDAGELPLCRSPDRGDALVIAGDGQPATRVRYAWADAPVVNLFDARPLPVPGFELADRAVKLDRRTALAGLAGGIACSAPGTAAPALPHAPDFVARDGTRLLRGGEPYRVPARTCGTRPGSAPTRRIGDRARLGRELDRLKALGLNNLRIMAAAEEGPLRNSIKPGFSRPDGTLDRRCSAGLDYALAEIAGAG